MTPRALSASFAFALVLWMAAPAPAQVEHLSATTRHAILTDQFVVVRQVAKIPHSVTAAAAAARGPNMGDDPLVLADPGKPFQSTDVIVDGKLPGRRLIAAYVAGNDWIVHYEVGGVAHTYHVAFFRVHGNGATFVWQASVHVPLSGIDELRRLIREDKPNAIDDSYTRFY